MTDQNSADLYIYSSFKLHGRDLWRWKRGTNRVRARARAFNI